MTLAAVGERSCEARFVFVVYSFFGTGGGSALRRLTEPAPCMTGRRSLGYPSSPMVRFGDTSREAGVSSRCNKSATEGNRY
jgi:hypothetical protein